MQKSGGVTIGETAYGCYQMRPAEVLIFGTAANGETEIAAKKTIAKAEEYLAFESLYTAATVATLKTAVADLVDGDYADAEDTQFLIEEVEAAIAGLQNAVTYYTLSGNKWNDVTKNSFYSVWDPDLELVTGTNAASYTWNTKDPELPVNDANQPADANTKEMIDGFVNAYGTNTKWDANYYNTILFDLGEKSIVDRVDIAHHIYGNAASYMLGEVVVQTSLDGNHYISAVSGQGDPTAANVIHVNYDIAMDSFSFAPRAARYVRVTFKKLPSAHSVRPMEIAVFGYESPAKPLEAKITKAEAYLTASAYYKADGVTALENAVASGKAMIEAGDLADMSSAIVAIDNAFAGLTPVNERLIYSGNNWQATDLTTYQKYDASITELKNAGNTPVYHYTENSSAYPDAGIDAAHTKLAGGNIAGFGGVVVEGGWQYAKPIQAQWDLGTVAVLDRVDVWHFHESDTYKHNKDITVEISLDGETFTPIETRTAAGQDDLDKKVQIQYLDSFTFAPQKARYVRVTATRKSYVATLSEVVIFGIGVDYSALQAVVSKYDAEAIALLKTIATEDSVAALEAAIGEGAEICENASANQTETDAAIQKIEDAFSSVVYLEEVGILTNNLASDDAKAYYEGLNNINVAMTYTASGDSAASAMEEVLLKGAFGSYESGIWGGFDKGEADITAVFHAGEEIYVTGIDVYDWISTSQAVGKVKFEISEDGVDYTEIATVNSDWNGSNVAEIGIKESVNKNGRWLHKIGTGDIVPVKGSYIRLTFTKTSHQQIIDEVIIKGFQVPAEPTLYQATFGEATFIVDGASLEAYGTIVNSGDVELTGKVYTAIYNGNKLIGIAQNENDDGVVTVGTGSANTANWSTWMELDADIPADAKIVNFYWNGTTPLAENQVK